MLSRKLLGITAAALLLIAWGFYVTGNGKASWGIWEGLGMRWSGGLWQVCHGENCQMPENELWSEFFMDNRLRAARGFITVVCITAPFAAGSLIYIVVKDKFQPRYLLISKCLCALTFLLGIIGMSIGINYFTTVAPIAGKIVDFSLGTAARNTIIGVVLNFLGAVITFIIQPK